MIRTDAVQEIRDRLDIIEVIKDYVPGLRKAGRGWKACCPFHQERTPSFTVSQEKQLWYCFGSCHDGGDLFKFVMKAENLSFSEAAEKLAQRAGVQWRAAPETLGPAERQRLAIREALEFAKDHYRRLLETSPEAAAARAYLQKRGVSPESRERFELGLAVSDGTTFLEAALRKGFQSQLLQKAGLAAEREGGRLRDYFRGRLLFPIRDARGAVVGFGGRAMGDYEPKYLNTPETPVFIKSRTLYGLFAAGPSIRKEDRAVLVEGYMDALACHQHGVTNAVAPLGTAFTPEHAASLKRYCGAVTVLFDADSAGLAAALRASEALLEAGVAVNVASVPSGKDPDEFLLARGAEAFKAEVLGAATDPAEFRTRLELAKLGGVPKSGEEKARVAAAVLETVAKQPDAILKNEWMKRLAERLGLDEASLRTEARRKAQANGRERTRKAAAPAAAAEAALPKAEEDFLALVLRHPELAAQASDVTPEDFASEVGRAAWTAVLARCGESGWPQRLAGEMAAEGQGWFARLLVETRETDDPSRLLVMQKDALRRETFELSRFKELERTAPAMLDGKLPMDMAVVNEYMALYRKLKGSKPK